MAKATTPKPPTKTEVFSSDCRGDRPVEARRQQRIRCAGNDQIKKARQQPRRIAYVYDSWPGQNRRTAQASDQGTPGHESVHRRADHLQSEAGTQRREDSSAKEAQGYGVVIGAKSRRGSHPSGNWRHGAVLSETTDTPSCCWEFPTVLGVSFLVDMVCGRCALSIVQRKGKAPQPRAGVQVMHLTSRTPH